MSSSRLPGKALIQIGSEPLLWHVIQRAMLCQNASKIIVATSTERSDDAIEDYCSKLGVSCCRGSLNNLVERAYQTMYQYGLENMARVCGDRILLDYNSIDEAFKRIEGFNFVTNKNLHPPPGMLTEVLNFNVLKKLKEANLTSEEREHLTRFIYSNEKLFEIIFLNSLPFKEKNIRIVIDTDEDKIFFHRLFSNLEIKYGKEIHLYFNYKENLLGSSNSSLF